MALFGQSWRVAHAVAALETMAAVLLIADYVFRRFPDAKWRAIASVTAAMAIGLNPVVFTYGSLAQPYGMCLLALAAAFRCAVRAVESESARYSGAAGVCAGIAAASSLLTAAAIPVLLVWTLIHSPAGRRFNKALAFLAGAAVPFAPALWLFVLSPRATWFNLVQYHVLYRRLYWPDTYGHDFEVLTSWLNSGPALVLGMLAVGGWFYVVRHSDWPRPIKGEFRLCGWLTLGIASQVGFAHPTFQQYFLLIVPFLAVPAAAGLCVIAERVLARRYTLAVLLVSTLFLLGLGRRLYVERDDDDWRVYERIARQVDSVTPPTAPVFANEPVYFLTRRIPPAGLELYYTHRLHLPAAERAVYHLLTNQELSGQLKAGRFTTAYECDEDAVKFGFEHLYGQNRNWMIALSTGTSCSDTDWAGIGDRDSKLLSSNSSTARTVFAEVQVCVAGL